MGGIQSAPLDLTTTGPARDRPPPAGPSSTAGYPPSVDISPGRTARTGFFIMIPNLAFTWQLTEVHGWGLVGVHTALYLADMGRPPLLLEKPLMGTLRPENRAKLQSLEAPYQQVAAMADNAKGHMLLVKEFDVLHALGNGF